MQLFWTRNPWGSGLLLSTALAVLLVPANVLWQAGFPEWAFVLLFGAVWASFSLCLANDRFIEESGLILAQVLDESNDRLLCRIHRLEQELANLNDRLSDATSELEVRV